ncbi:hypothetical protein [Streptomyces sp. E-08]|uniref:hypothetical protein n=1 Tax=Streptomyces sp. E-08 TaxID=3404047 RepID=UPI003CEDB8D6
MMAALQAVWGEPETDPTEGADPTSLEILRRARGPVDYSHMHEANREAEEKHGQAVRARTAKLRREGVPYPEETARRQLDAEAEAAREQARNRWVHEAMRRSNDSEQQQAEWEARQQAAPPGRQAGAGRPVRDPGRSERPPG